MRLPPLSVSFLMCGAVATFFLGLRLWRPLPSQTQGRSKNKEKIPFFVHVHKSGGTTMCKTAQANGEAVNRDNNCNMKGDGLNTIDEKVLSRRCEERYQLAKEERYSFIAMERFMLEDELDCKDRFTYVLVVRDPEQRHESHVDFHRTVRRRPKNALGVSLTDNDISGDNYLTRILIGKKGFDGTLPIGSITVEHGEEAKKKLEQFDIIISLEKFEQHKVQLVSHFGWSEWIGVANARHARSKEAKEGWKEGGPSQSDQGNGPTSFARRNAVDLAVYKHARALAEHLTTRARTKR